jgi:RNase H-fold protein (predicted Holliday junction resolvase)
MEILDIQTNPNSDNSISPSKKVSFKFYLVVKWKVDFIIVGLPKNNNKINKLQS